MTAQEQHMLQGLTQRIGGTQLADKDPEAEQYLRETLGRNPDAMYIMAQTLLVQQFGLEQAQKQIADARAQIEQLRQAPPPEPKHTSFLGGLLGNDEAPRHVAPPPPPPPYAEQQYQAVPPQYAPPQQYGPPQGGFGMPPQQGGGGFLRSAMTTAAGVAAGAVAFEGIESLMHGFGHSGGYGSGFGGMGGGGFGGGERTEVVNNYYGDSAQHEHGMSSDIEDRRDGGSRFEQAVDSNDHGQDSGQGQIADGQTPRDDFADIGNDAYDTSADSNDSNDSSNDVQDDSSSFDDSSSDSGSDFDSGGGGDSSDGS
jgi:hypothetical protein